MSSCIVLTKHSADMKKVLYLFLFPILLSCATNDYVVESDYSYHGKFNRYKTFGFSINESFAGVIEDKELIESSLKKTLQAWGYRHITNKPDLLVVYSFYFDDVNLQGYLQPDFPFWLSQNFRGLIIQQDSTENPSIQTINNKIKEDYDKKRLELKEGTVLISFFDRKRNQAVWQGYASGVFGADRNKNARIIRSAIIQIMDEYKVLAFSKNS